MRWIFLLLPWLELFSLIQLGSEIGALTTLLYVFVTFVIGLSLLRMQGQQVTQKLRAAGSNQVFGAQLFGAELAMGLAGLLLMIPGLITDSLAVVAILLRLLGGIGRGRPREQSEQPFPGFRDGPPSGNDTIDGEFRRLDDD